VGLAYITFEVVNSLDLDLVGLGRQDASQVRSLVLADVLMDTGASHLCLPASTISRLGLTLSRTRSVDTATGRSQIRVFRNALLKYEDREAEVEVLELPDGVRPLLGVLPMEAMGLEPDLTTHAPRKLPMDADHSYITIF
jgi:predicted aspartyl protease